MKSKSLFLKCAKHFGALFVFLFLNTLYAQQGTTVTGVIIDSETNTPLPGVNVIEKGTRNGTSTDFDGKYTLTVSTPDAHLEFSYIGYKTLDVAVAGQSSIKVSLEPDAQSLNEVVVVGYGTVKKSDLTGAIASVDSETITERKVNSPLEGIQGSVPGVNITNNSGRLGDGFTVNIRGANSYGASDPLFIVDGVPTDGIDFLNPQDIERIDVLKDASSAAIYGSRGANGVVIVTTKGGDSVKGGVNVSVESSFGVTQVARMPDFMSGEEWWAYHQVAYLNQGNPMGDTPAINLGFAGNNSPELVKRANAGYSFDWGDEVLKDGYMQNNYVSLSGRAENGLSYNVGLGMQKDEGIIDRESSKKYNFKAGLNHKINEKFLFGLNLTIANRVEQLGSDLAMQEALRLNPLTSPWAVDADGNQLEGELFYQPGKLTYPDGSWAFNKTSTINPLVEIQNTSQERKQWVTLGNIFLDYKPLDWLSFRTTFSAGSTNLRLGRYAGEFSNGGGTQGNNASITKTENFNFTWDNQFNINKTFNDVHTISFLGLQSLYSNQTEHSYAYSANQPFEKDWYNLGSGAQGSFNLTELDSDGNPILDYRKNTLSSYAVRLNYAYKDKYLITASNRWDGSSVLADGNKWSTFPSLALGWKISEEGFLNTSSVVSNLKLRASIGYTGNDNVSPYSTLNGIPNQTYYDFNGNPANGYISNQVANVNLGWERTRELNFGLDFGFFNQRIEGTLDIYDRLSDDLIFPQKLPVESGSGFINNNIGSLSNKGVEVGLITRNIQTKLVTWTTTFTFTKNTNAVESANGQSEFDDPGNGLFIGEPLNPHYNYVFDGVWQDSEAAEAASYGMKEGQARPKDLNNDGAITDEDRAIIGTEQPDWTGGLTSILKVGNFDFSVSAITSQGVTVLSNFHDNFADTADRGRQKLAFDSYYVPANGAGLPQQYSNTNPRPRGEGDYWSTNFAFYRDASFTKIKNIALGYTLGDNIIQKLKIQSLRVYANVLDPFVFTDYDGWDPEWAGASLGTGRPSSVTYQLGVSLKL
ncbi:TonB-dependent receptor [Tamlana sp. s12]|uniref:SusC/RagA family TonB-linked outer membrane protein n=1 Tax=Tamlana sp. s12 TaxID=1630406 RepID=UPI00080109C2|nr:TonB-dependent receptor [Tamlana sp. s12]OBQ52224.1 TonB-dependent receptor [Tamlana sp. s12]QQY82337.1 TonB-dependent receptor [Tamlana sp. s12]